MNLPANFVMPIEACYDRFIMHATSITVTRIVRKSDYISRFSASNIYGLFKDNKTSHNATQISNITVCFTQLLRNLSIVNKYTGKKQKTRYEHSTLSCFCGICYKNALFKVTRKRKSNTGKNLQKKASSPSHFTTNCHQQVYQI